MSLDPHLGQRIRRARQARGWTQPQLAEAAGVSLRAVGNWERGRVPRAHRVPALEQVLGVKLVDDPEPAPTPKPAEQPDQPDAAADSLPGYIRHGMATHALTSYRDVAKATGVHHETIRRVLNGQGVPSDEVLRGLSDGLGLSLRRLRELAGRPVGDAVPFELPAVASQLNPRERRLVLDLVYTILEAHTSRDNSTGPGNRDEDSSEDSDGGVNGED